MNKKVVVMKRAFVGCAIVLSMIAVFRLYSHHGQEKKADLVVFSFNRPLQLYAFLESAQKYLYGVGETHVIFRASDDQYLKAYDQVKDHFRNCIYHQQSAQPAQDFKPLTLKASFESSAEYIVYAVDDIVIKDAIDLTYCAKALEKYDGYGFFFRVGMNTTICYPVKGYQGVPPLKKEEDQIFSWQFMEGRGDWRYPNNVDMTLYRKKEIEGMLRVGSYHQPNIMEVVFMESARTIFRRKGLCFEQSKIVNLPLNIVQNVRLQNPSMREYTPLDLLKKFNENLKMDIDPLFRVANRSAHMDYSPTFITR